MPLTYNIDPTAGVARMECRGVLTNEDVLDTLERLHGDPARQPGMPTFVDCRSIEEMRVTPAGMQAAASLKAALVDPGQPPWAVAIVAPQEEVFWVARIYEVLRVGSPERVRVFRDPAAAERWLTGIKALAPLWLLALFS
jgi:hypothetical protein